MQSQRTAKLTAKAPKIRRFSIGLVHIFRSRLIGVKIRFVHKFRSRRCRIVRKIGALSGVVTENQRTLPHFSKLNNLNPKVKNESKGVLPIGN